MLSSVDTTKTTGGLFFSLSMWMFICFFRSQCKNKVTNMSESKCNLQSSMEKGEGHSQENHLKDTTENMQVGPLQELDLNNRNIESPSSVQGPQHFQCGKHKTEDEFDDIVYSALRADKSKIEGISKCLSAPMLFPCFSKSSKVSILKAEEPMSRTTTNDHQDVTVSSFEDSIYPSQVSSEPICPTTTKVNSDLTLFPNNDDAQLEETELGCDMAGVLSKNIAGIFPAANCYSHEVKLNTEAGIDQEKSHEDFNHDTGIVRYFETQIELMGKMINKAHVIEGEIIEDTSSQLRKFEVSKAFGKKSKTWPSFYDSVNNSVIFQLKTEQEPKRPIVRNENDMDHTGETHGSYFWKEMQEYSKITDDVCNIKRKKYILSDDQCKYNAHPSDCQDIDDEQPGPSNVIQMQRVKNKQHQALLHGQTLQENLWKYHKNCCDEYQPCQTASKVLKQIKALEKTQLMQKTKQSPPLDEELLEENPSLPLSLISLPKHHIMAKTEILSKMTCSSLPDLSQYGHHQVCASHDAPSLKTSIEVSVNVDDNTAIMTTPSLGHLDLPVICVAHDEHLKNMSSYNINLPVLEDQTKNFVTSEKEMNNVSSSTLALPIIDAPAEDLVGGKMRLDDKSVSNLAPPNINALTDTIRSKNEKNKSASPKELPTIGEPLLSVSVQNTCLENMTSNLYLPVAGIHNLDIVKSLPPIKILKERDDVKDNEPEISNNMEITITDPEIAGNHSFEKKGLQLNLEIKAQKSQTLSKPDANSMSINKENNIAVVHSSTSNPFNGMIANHGEVTTEENASMPTEEPLKIEFSNVSLDTQTHLTTSVSYSNSIQDGEEVTDWPKIADLVKHSSTISLSSNFDILNYHLFPLFNPQHENVYDTSNKPNSNLIVDECERAETMAHQLCDIDDHNNMAVEEFNCTVVQQYDIEIEDRKGLNSMENKAFYIQDETSQHHEIYSEEKAGLEILDTQSIFKDQPYTNLHFLEYAEKAQIQMGNLEGMKAMNPNSVSQIINGDKVDPTCYKDSTHTSNLDMLVNSRPEAQPRNENPCDDQTDDTVNANDQTVNHKGHSLTIPVNNRPSEENKGSEDLLKDLTCSPDANFETSEAEDPLSQTNMTDIRNYRDLSTAAITDEAVDFKGYEKLILRVKSNPDMVDINHVVESFEDNFNIFQDILSSDSTAAIEKICTLTGSKKRDILIAEALSDSLKNKNGDDDFNGIKYNLKESDCHFDESVNALRKPLIDGITICNSEAAFNNWQANRINAMDASLCKTEKQIKDDQVLGVQNISKTYSKRIWSDQKSKTHRQLKTSNKVPPANVQEFDLKDYLSCRINRRPFYSVFPFPTKTPSMEDGEVEKNSTLEGEPSANDSGTTRPHLVFKLSENKTMEAFEYLTYLYARSPKVCPGSLEGLNVVSDMDDDISVLANLNFCKVALPGDFTKQEISTDIQEVYINPADPENVYLPPSKEELKADDELAVLHVIYALKRSLELSHNIETETDFKKN